jgi:hypothetical protein
MRDPLARFAAQLDQEQVMNTPNRPFNGKRPLCPRLLRAHAILLPMMALVLSPSPTVAQGILAERGCPLHHCNVEGTGVMRGALVEQVQHVSHNKDLGVLRFQGCSGDGDRLSCLFARDTASGPHAGTLKVIDATTLQPLWGSAGRADSYDPVDGQTLGQVPLNLLGGRIAAGDAAVHALYGPNGRVLATLALGGAGNNFGLTPIGESWGVVSQADGVLTLVDLVAWEPVAALTLRDPQTQARVRLVAPSSGTDGVLYALGVGSRGEPGLLFAVGVDEATRTLVVRSSFAFGGASGASPVVFAPRDSDLAQALVILHLPGLAGEDAPVHRLVALADEGDRLTPAWMLPLAGPLAVAPTIDPLTRTLFYATSSSARVVQLNALTGEPIREFDMAALSSMPAGFRLNGHLGATRDGVRFTLLLSGAAPADQPGEGQYVLAFQPTLGNGHLLWTHRIAARPDTYTAAWNLGPSTTPDIVCPIVVGPRSGITRLCDTGP